MSNLNRIWDPVTNNFVKLDGKKGNNVLKQYLKCLQNITSMRGGGSIGTMHIFKATWCHWCQQSKPVFDSLIKDATKNKYEVKIYDADDEDQKKKFTEFSVQSFPSIYFEDKGGGIHKYLTDNRKKKEINKWALGFA